MAKMLDRIFVKRFKVGLKGTSKFNELVPASTQLEAKKIYAFKRNRKTLKDIIIKK